MKKIQDPLIATNTKSSINKNRDSFSDFPRRIDTSKGNTHSSTEDYRLFGKSSKLKKSEKINKQDNENNNNENFSIGTVQTCNIPRGDKKSSKKFFSLNYENFMDDILFSKLPSVEISNNLNFIMPSKILGVEIIRKIEMKIEELKKTEIYQNKEKELQSLEFKEFYSKIFRRRISPFFKTDYNFKVKNIINDITYKRNIKANGDSFYVAVIYSYLERLILTKHVNIWKNIISYIFLNKEKIIEKSKQEMNNFNEDIIEKINDILIIIFLLINNKTTDYKNALKYLNYSFCYYDYFYIGMINLLKIKIIEFITLNKNEKSWNFLGENKILSSKFFMRKKFSNIKNIYQKILTSKKNQIF